jgi:threonine dehydrogenase-like Zn-dependent dehydrogenase
MRAVVYTGRFSVAVEEVPQPRLEAPGDALVRTKVLLHPAA